LGSTRAIVDNSGNIKEQKDYYAFGTEHENSNLMTSTNRWGYNGKEKQTIRNLDYLYYGARMLRDFSWISIDPLCEMYYSISPYAYCNNNPIKYIDPDGSVRKTSQEIKSQMPGINPQLSGICNAAL
jgi:RHS repeat-associated protein